MKAARILLPLLIALALFAAACGSDNDSDAAGSAPAQTEAPADTNAPAETEAPADTEAHSDEGHSDSSFSGTLTIGAIPDQDPEILARTYELLTGYLEQELPGVTIEYVPAVNYDATVSAFGVGDLDLVWFGAVTGIQARLEVDGSQAIAQRDLDDDFTSVFIARADSGMEPIDDIAGLSALAGRSLTFGSESSTSGRLMPQYNLGQAGLDVNADFDGPVGFSGSHDATIELVQAGTYEVGGLNSQVWRSRVESGDVDPEEVIVLFETPNYYNYHWVGQPDIDERVGEGATAAFVKALMNLDPADETEAEILSLFGAERFIETQSSNYDDIEAVAREIGDHPLNTRPLSADLGAVLDLRQVGVVRQGRTILAGVDLRVDPGQTVALVGPSGAGKTTLLGVIGGRVVPDEGTVTVLGITDHGRLSGRERRRAMGRIGSMAQDLHLAGSLRAVHNVNAGHLHRWSTGRAVMSLIWPRDRAAASAALDQVGLGDRLWARTDSLSGGERQRVALARVLVHDPPLTLADEPVSSLDPSLGDQAMSILAGRSATTIVSLHDPDLARRYADRIIGLRAGSVQFDLPAAEVTDRLLDEIYGGAGTPAA